MLKTIEVNGINIRYNEEGPDDGHPIILLHGWGCSHATLASIENILAGKMHVYNIDLPGFGDSDEPDSVWGVEEYTKTIEEFIRRLKINRPILLGHSFGGRISILLSSRNDIGKIILVDAAGVKPTRSVKYYIKIYFYKLIKHTLPVLLGRKLGNQLLDRYRGRAGSSDYASSTPMMRAILSKCVNEDLCDVMPLIKASTLLIWGDNDTATPISDAKKMERLIPDAGLVSFQECGHYSFLDNPVGFRAVIKEFLKNELK